VLEKPKNLINLKNIQEKIKNITEKINQENTKNKNNIIN
jgi:hypoxanthine-guanine phosphoribosyltransferase